MCMDNYFKKNSQNWGIIALLLPVALMAACSFGPISSESAANSSGEVDSGSECANQSITGDAGNNAIYGDCGNDTLNGLEGDDILSGLDGNDILIGGVGADIFRMSGNFGNDSIGRDGSPDIDAGDTVVFTDSMALTYNYSGTDLTIMQGDNRVVIYGANTTSGVRLDGVLSRSFVDFTLKHGELTHQLIVGTSGNDNILFGVDLINITQLFGSRGADILFGLDGHDYIYGEEGSDILFGGADNDLLAGNEENDFLNGGSGNDQLYGGGYSPDTSSRGILDNAQGSDTFIFDPGFGDDTIGSIYGDAFRTGIDTSDTLQFNDTSSLALTWYGANLTIAQREDSVLIYNATEATSDGGFRIMWNGLVERVDSTTDLMVDGN